MVSGIPTSRTTGAVGFSKACFLGASSSIFLPLLRLRRCLVSSLSTSLISRIFLATLGCLKAFLEGVASRCDRLDASSKDLPGTLSFASVFPRPRLPECLSPSADCLSTTSVSTAGITAKTGSGSKRDSSATGLGEGTSEHVLDESLQPFHFLFAARVDFPQPLLLWGIHLWLLANDLKI